MIDKDAPAYRQGYASYPGEDRNPYDDGSPGFELWEQGRKEGWEDWQI